jgi:hypothetical protein
VLVGYPPEHMSAVVNPHYREVHIFGADTESIKDRLCVLYASDVLFKDVFDTFTYVYVKWDVPYGVLTYRSQRETSLKTALDALGLHEGVVHIYADNRDV